MADRISNYRVARLLVYPSAIVGGHGDWALTAVDTRRGVPYATMLGRGQLDGLTRECSEQEIWAAIWWVANRHYRSPSD